MPLIIKPRSLGFLSKLERRRAGATYMISALGLFDLADPNPDNFGNEQALWVMATKALPPGGMLDISTPKPNAEVLIGGYAAAPDGVAVQRMLVDAQVGPMRKQLIVHGDRYWSIEQNSVVATEPVPFVQMPLTPQRSFGGEGYDANPQGLGFAALERLKAGALVALPNVERPDQLIRAVGDRPEAAAFGMADLTDPARRKFAGTYDAHWIKSVAPSLPDDVDPRFFLLAPPDQQLNGYFVGGEPYRLQGFCKDHPVIAARIPAFRVRCFITFGSADRAPVEFVATADTLWLFAGARRGVLIYHAAVPVEDVDAKDIFSVMLAYERTGDEPKPISYYREVARLRSSPDTAPLYAFADHQLAPERSPETIARKVAAREALRQQRADQMRDAWRWAVARQLAQSGLPEHLQVSPPEPDFSAGDFPVLTDEDLEEGDIDLAALLDATEAMMESATAQAEKQQAQAAKIQAAQAALASPDAEPAAVDALFAALDELTGENIAAAIDQMMTGADALPGKETLPDVAAEAMPDKLPSPQDWRSLMLEHSKQPEIAEDRQFNIARARFMGEVEGGPLIEARNAMISARDVPTPSLVMPGFPEGIAKPEPKLEPVTIHALLDRLEIPKGGAEKAGALPAELEKIDATLRTQFPKLAAKGGSPIDFLINDAAQQAEQGSPEDALARAGQLKADALSNALAELDTQEANLLKGQAEMRRSMPTPSFPAEPLTETVAARLGQYIIEQLRAGVSLAGRDCAGANLRNANLVNADLTGILLENADLTGAKLSGALLCQAALTGARLDGANLSGCDLTDANLGSASANGARFDNVELRRTMMLDADLTQSSFLGARLIDLQFIKAKLDGAQFDRAEIRSTVFVQSTLEASRWHAARLEQVQVLECRLDQSSFREARLFRCAFAKASLVAADFTSADVSRTSFVGDTDLSGAQFGEALGNHTSFFGAKLIGARFERSAFDSATFSEADLTGASLRLASLKRALFGSAKLSGADCLGANLLNAQLRRADFTAASLRGANLYGCDFDGTVFIAADLSAANLDKTFLAVNTNAG